MPHRGPSRDRGFVTVEAALVLPLLVAVFAACLAGIACLVSQLRCMDAAREAARLAGRGDLAGANAAASALAGGAAIDIQVGDDLVHVRVSARPLSGLLPGIEVLGTAVAAVEGGTG